VCTTSKQESAETFGEIIFKNLCPKFLSYFHKKLEDSFMISARSNAESTYLTSCFAGDNASNRHIFKVNQHIFKVKAPQLFTGVRASFHLSVPDGLLEPPPSV
jgi:hypothetical protein